MKDSRGARVYVKENTNQLFFSQKARGKGVLHVRVMVKGLGAERKVGVGVSFPYFYFLRHCACFLNSGWSQLTWFL